jgi:hypothetical protein
MKRTGIHNAIYRVSNAVTQTARPQTGLFSVLQQKLSAPAEPQPAVWRLTAQLSEEARLMTFPLRERMVVGRSSRKDPNARPDVDLAQCAGKERGVSRQHALLHFQDGQLFVEDLESTNGTRINGLKIEAGQQYKLRSGDELEFGRLRMVIRIVRAG